MKVTYGYQHEIVRPYPVVTIGNFDGHHVGHRALLQAVIETARKVGGTALVLTFDPHPVRILAPHANLRFLTGPEEKLEFFRTAGVDEVVFVEFTRSFAALPPEAFAEQVLVQGLRTKELFVGRHFVFGHNRAGTVEDLAALGARHGFLVHPMDPVLAGGVIVSSTRIRQLIQAGSVDQATPLLGRRYTIAGTVAHGAQRGYEVGWRTANLRPPADRVMPPDGVYATVTLWKERRYDSISYIGTRPTFGAGERLLEVHLLDEELDLYGERIVVEFVGRIRGDVRFSGMEALSRQIALDVESARELLRDVQPTQAIMEK
ncbi:MAG: bifunctional riboflavin kinase/FAD synthetase [Nitrospira sp.]|nr:bifunctional riboflavin kinase/FAD synthetase [Nitrospira sp.]MCP9443159.1 bifunctional riboflavin kinase/FAD synthetase [Nitrospira sp.]